jgi:anaerobic magnesium-protoporphyrin IX monomethyl ester cyclase
MNKSHNLTPSRQPSYLLITPPLTDPTAPYHSISYLIGATTAAGYTDFRALDANIEALNYLTQPAEVAALLAECAVLRERLETAASLTRAEQLAYRYALKAVGLRADAPTRAIGIFQDPTRFYDYPTYRQAMFTIKRWLDVLSVRGFPGQFAGFSLNTNGVGNLASLDDLSNPTYLGQLMHPFATYFTGPFLCHLQTRRWDLVGLSVNYLSQLPFALYMVGLIRATLPDAFICLGGTEVTDDVKYLQDRRRLWTLFPHVDALVVGEGESALIEILAALAGRRPLRPGRPGILLPQDRLPSAFPYPVVTEDLSTLPAPRYDIWDWTQYWAPEPVVLYSPTRGCYWNKCTFCDYGLNTDLPTSPSRERPIAQVIEELRALSRFARTVYFAVDAMSPRYLQRLTTTLVRSGLQLRWSAELRLEKTLTKGLAGQLRDAGCVSVSFGYESGSQRVLDLIDKGVQITDLPAILAALATAHIGVQMMGFLGFPGETPQDAEATRAFLHAHQHLWTIAGIGDFVLTPGAIVAQRYRDFGITAIGPYQGDDIARSLYWVDQEGKPHIQEDLQSSTLAALAAPLSRFTDGRPFVGSIDSSHSLLYFGKYGRSLLPIPGTSGSPLVQIVETVQYPSPFLCVDEFCNTKDLADFHRQRRRGGQSVGFREMQAWLQEHSHPGQRVDERAALLEIFPSGDILPLPAGDRDHTLASTHAYTELKRTLLRGLGVL